MKGRTAGKLSQIEAALAGDGMLLLGSHQLNAQPLTRGPTMTEATATSTPVPPVKRRELLGWAFYDFANSGYTTVVLTTVFSAYFVAVVAGDFGAGTATLLWTLIGATANLIVLLSAPLVGAVADQLATKKQFLFAATVGCAGGTALLALVGPGDVALAACLVVLSSVCFAFGENLIAAFLPEIAPPEKMGRISGYGWSFGYLGGLLALGACLIYISWAQESGAQESEYVPVTMLITAGLFVCAALPTFLWLRERAVRRPLVGATSRMSAGLSRVRHTLSHAAQFKDLFRFLQCLALYQAGVSTVVVVASIYAQQEFGFGMQDLITLIMVVNISATIGAFLFGLIQDRLGAIRSVACSLLLWVIAVLLAWFTDDRAGLWLAGNLIGIAMGASQSGGRAVIGRFTPAAQSGEFFGLWGLVNRLAAIVGPLSYGLLSHLAGDLRTAMLSTLAFFLLGLLLLARVSDARGRQAAIDAAAQ
jgi:UMF1 family MFS transporter